MPTPGTTQNPPNPTKPQPSGREKPAPTEIPEPAPDSKSVGGSRLPVVRLLRIAELIREGKCPIIQELAVEFEVTTRTIERDFEFLRNQCRMEFTFDRAKKVFRATTIMVPLPAMHLTIPEITALLIGRRAVQSHLGAGLFELATRAIEKITTFMTDEQAAEIRQLDAMISYCGIPSLGRIDPTIFPALAQAMRDTRELELLYLKSEADEPAWRRVRPLHLYFRNNRWYLWALDASRKFMGRRFALPRMQSVRTLASVFKRPRSFDPEEVIANTVGIYGGGPPESIRLRLSRKAAQWMEESPLHATQQIEEKPDGTFEFTAEIAITPELEGNLLRWGLEVEVLEPKRLKDAVLATARAIVERG
jgi:predicted DNA-binding transcriptional regulator YafY